MALSNQQIERYSRQIIVAKVGGIGQERLLASRILVAGEISDIEPVLAYLVGAGVGTIALRVADAAHGTSAQIADRCSRLIARMRGLNPDVTVTVVHDIPAKLDLVLMLAGSEAALADARQQCARPWQAPIVFARLATDAKIALLPARPPCPLCADASLLAPFARRAGEAEFAAMVAAVEAFKLLVRHTPQAGAAIVAFDGYAAKARNLSALTGDARGCACGAVAAVASSKEDCDG